jgi:hypothetical protein
MRYKEDARTGSFSTEAKEVATGSGRPDFSRFLADPGIFKYLIKMAR